MGEEEEEEEDFCAFSHLYRASILSLRNPDYTDKGTKGGYDPVYSRRRKEKETHKLSDDALACLAV